MRNKIIKRKNVYRRLLQTPDILIIQVLAKKKCWINRPYAFGFSRLAHQLNVNFSSRTLVLLCVHRSEPHDQTHWCV